MFYVEPRKVATAVAIALRSLNWTGINSTGRVLYLDALHTEGDRLFLAGCTLVEQPNGVRLILSVTGLAGAIAPSECEEKLIAILSATNQGLHDGQVDAKETFLSNPIEN